MFPNQLKNDLETFHYDIQSNKQFYQLIMDFLINYFQNKNHIKTHKVH